MNASRSLTQDSDSIVVVSLRRRVFTPISIFFVILAAFFATRTDLPGWVVIAPLAVSILVFGLPHEALDHLVPARLRLDVLRKPPAPPSPSSILWWPRAPLRCGRLALPPRLSVSSP